MMAVKAPTKRRAKRAEQPKVDWALVLRWASLMLLLAVVSSGSAWGLQTLTDPKVLPLKVIKIDGKLRHLKPGDLERAVGRAVQGNFFTVDLDRVRQAALRLAWVDQASVRRVWPDTLVMWVNEQEPLARWGDKALVNGRGDLFRPNPKELPEGLPRLAGPDDRSREVVSQFRRMGKRLSSVGLNLVRLSMDDRRAWRLGFARDFQVRLGSTAIDERLERFIRIYPRLQKARPEIIELVDLRYTNGVSVRWGAPLPASEESDLGDGNGKKQSAREGGGQV